MDLTYIPVKEPATAARGRTGGCLIACFGVSSGHRQTHRKSFMSKRLVHKKTSKAQARPGRPRRVESVRPNRFHTFLKRLRAGGRSNMYGAIPYLMHAFALDRESAFRIVCEWVDQQHAEQQDHAAEASTGG
jgi:hypothetical protein